MSADRIRVGAECRRRHGPANGQAGTFVWFNTRGEPTCENSMFLPRALRVAGSRSRYLLYAAALTPKAPNLCTTAQKRCRPQAKRRFLCLQRRRWRSEPGGIINRRQLRQPLRDGRFRGRFGLSPHTQPLLRSSREGKSRLWDRVQALDIRPRDNSAYVFRRQRRSGPSRSPV